MPTYTSPSTHTFGSSAGTLTTQGHGLSYNFLRDALTTCGFVQTADTGQYTHYALGNTTQPAAVVGNASLGYMIFRMNDALQATKPIFFKLGFWAASATNNFSGLHFEIGEGSDGAGNLTGRRIGRNLCWVAATAQGTVWNAGLVTRAAGNGSDFALSFHEPSSPPGNTPTEQQSMFMSIERTRDANGAHDGEGVLVAVSFNTNAGTAGSYQYSLAFPTNGTIPADTVANIGFVRGGMLPVRSRDYGITSMNQGNVLGPFIPTHFGLFPKYRQTRLSFLYVHNDLPWDTTFSMDINGTPRTFRAAGWPQGRHLHSNTNLAAAGFSDWGNGADYGYGYRPMGLAHLWE